MAAAPPTPRWLRWAAALVLLLAAAGPGACQSDTVKGILNRPDNKLPLSKISGTRYLERIAGNYKTDDGSSIMEMLVAQQRWRRRANDDGVEELGSMYDCQPTFKVTRSVSSWFRTRTVEVGLCFTVCVDHPGCTSTAPLVINGDGGSASQELAVLLWCGLQVTSHETQEFVELRTPGNKEGSTKPVCRNVVDRVGSPNVASADVPPPQNPTLRRRLNVAAFRRVNTRQHDDELTIYTHDLWSHWLWPVTLAKMRTNEDGSSSAAILSPPLDRMTFTEQLNGKLTQTPVASIIQDAWVVTPRPSGFVMAAYVMWRPDLDRRWFAFATYGVGTTTALSAYRDVNGDCASVEAGMWTSAAKWRNTSVATGLADAPLCRFLDLPNVTSVDQVGGSWAYAGTTAYGRLQRKRDNNHCPIILDKPKVERDSYVLSCHDDQVLFMLNTYGGDVCRNANYLVHPAVETMLQAGVHDVTYNDAWAYYSNVLRPAAPEGGEPHPLLVNDDDNYVLMDASLQFNVTELWQWQLRALANTERRLHDMTINDDNEATIIVAFTTLLIATISIPQHFNTDMRLKVLGWGRALCAKCGVAPKPAVILAFVGVLRFTASAVVVGPAIFSFLSVMAQESGTHMDTGFPTVVFDGRAPPACSDARYGEVGIGTFENQLIVTTVQTGAVVAICGLACLAILVAAVLTVLKTRKLMRQQEPVVNALDVATS
jgi:hypothetical protein